MSGTRPLSKARTVSSGEHIAELELRIAKLEKINKVLMDRVEIGVDSQANAYSLFQTAIGLERQVTLRTNELTHTLRRLEQMNDQLVLAKDIAEQANRSKTRFLAQASHDLLQPLNAASLAVSTLTEILNDDEGLRLARQIERALTNIENLLRTLLDISKLDAGIIVPQITTVALAELLADLAADYTPWAMRRELELRVKAANVFVSTDSSMLSRILQNLVCNALRYTQKGRVLVGVRRRPTTIRIDVLDTGPGIPHDQYALIFEEFHRGRGQPAANDIGLGLGLGLGLSIVQRLVDALGHGISLRSRVGRGTCFSIELPRVEPPDLLSPPPLDEHISLGWGISGAFVVVIDNDTAVREAIADLIMRWDCEAIAAASGEEASRIVSELGQRPDLLIVDYHLDGETALETIGSFFTNHDSSIPVIVVTADYDDAIEARVSAAGMVLLRKPVKPANLRALMTHLLA